MNIQLLFEELSILANQFKIEHFKESSKGIRTANSN